MTIFLIATLAYHALISIVWAKWFRVSYVTSFALSIPTLLGVNIVIVWLLHAVGVNNALSICYVIWLVIALALLLKLDRRSLNFRLTSLYPAVGVGLLSTIIWALGISNPAKPPQDNDAVIHTFGIRYLSEHGSLLNCQIPRDGLFNLGNRFMPCGSYEIAASYLRWNNDSAIPVLNGLYLVSAFFLPFGFISVWAIRKAKGLGLIVPGLSSITFLIAPYAINGLMPLIFGFAFVVPLANFLATNSFKNGRSLLFAGTSTLGLAIIHPLPLIIVLTIFVTSRAPNLRLVNWKRSRRAIALLISFAIVPLLLILNNSKYLFQGLKTSNNADDGGLSISVVHQLLLGNSWTRPQPAIVALIVLGVVHLCRRGDLFQRACALVSCGLYALWMTDAVANTFLDVVRIPFYGQWYRVLAAFQIVSVVPLAAGISVLLQIRIVQSKNIVRNAVVLLLLAGFSISLATGGRIVGQAWSRDTTQNPKVLSEMIKLEPFLGFRALNDPADGSMWAYGISGVQVVAAVDRGVDLRYGEVISALERNQDFNFACSVIDAMELDGILLIDRSKANTNKLLLNGIINEPVLADGSIFLAFFSAEFERICSNTLVSCVEATTTPTWYHQIRDERMPSAPCA